MRVGEALLKSGDIGQEDLDRALGIQKIWGSPIGTILMAQGIINGQQLARVLSEQSGLPYRNLVEEPPDPEAVSLGVRGVGEDFLRRRQMVPCEVGEGGVLGVALVNPEDREGLEELARRLGCPVEPFVTSDRDLYFALDRSFRKRYVDESVMGLFFRTPEESALVTFSGGQILFLGALVSLLAAAFWRDPTRTGTALFVAVNAFYLVSILFKLAASLQGARYEIQEQVSDEEVAALREEDLPVYTLLLPLYREPGVVPKLVEGIRNLDYPASRLDVKVLLEEDDPQTLQAFREARPPANFQIVRVPRSVPTTKPKACNYGLLFAKGEYLTIYDAEDVPERDQLKKAVAAFRKGPPELVCIQAALNYYNSEQNFLTRMFTLEYSYWFDYMLPGIEALRLPIPLGGTSNHFRTRVLRELGGWDPFNVTEDADLGVRAGAHRYRVATLNSTTYEEANSRLGNWLRQRSRWIKGYMQTYLVHMRHPLRLYRRIGGRAFWGFQLLIGGTCVTFLVNPLLWGLFLLWLTLRPEALSLLFPPGVFAMSTFCLVVGNALAIHLNMLAVFRRKLFRLTPYALLNPIYWLLHSLAAYKALWQLFTKPFYWEKTTHGLG
ncbi:General secretory system II protein E domain protein [Aminomonas paucivorans DSM 12260]|uniref:General secretory system II protein E domain protein n=1 Tax=Aminomonas paucivorans DSM 12260 TaxID=584708 RepID=E3CZC9_9BACT|nr:glycosyltransferase family 2 protein [Aminomonas paucivorans]EFQ24626.1 General secretory system II protein E domain protein [Aminomonas paucivorans DSM 12260]